MLSFYFYHMFFYPWYFCFPPWTLNLMLTRYHWREIKALRIVITNSSGLKMPEFYNHHSIFSLIRWKSQKFCLLMISRDHFSSPSNCWYKMKGSHLQQIHPDLVADLVFWKVKTTINSIWWWCRFLLPVKSHKLLSVLLLSYQNLFYLVWDYTPPSLQYCRFSAWQWWICLYI